MTLKLIKVLNSESEYRQYDAINYSKLKALETNPEFLISEEKNYSDGLRFGDAVDTLIFSGKKAFDNKFKIIEFNRPSNQLGELADHCLIKLYTGLTFEELSEALVLDYSEDLKLFGNVKDPVKRAAKITKDFWDYIGEKMTTDKILITYDEYSSVITAVEMLKSNIYTHEYFKGEETFINQLPIVFKYEGVVFKALLDIVKINHESKVICPADLKTMSEYVTSFPNKIIKWRYDIQQTLYTLAIQAYRDKYYPDYTIEGFRFVVISSQEINKPIVYHVYNPRAFIIKANQSRVKLLKHVDVLVDEYLIHKQQNNYSYPAEVLLKGEITL